MEKLLSVPEVASYLRCSPYSVRNWLRLRKLKKTKASGRTLVSESDLRAFLESSSAILAKRQRQKAGAR